MNTSSLKDRLLNANLNLTEEDFATHYSDLYVVNKPMVYEWLRMNYQFFKNIEYFISQVGSNWNGAGKQCLDIPFANEEYFDKKPK